MNFKQRKLKGFGTITETEISTGKWYLPIEFFPDYSNLTMKLKEISIDDRMILKERIFLDIMAQNKIISKYTTKLNLVNKTGLLMLLCRRETMTKLFELEKTL
jgi:hypothetical protein